MFKTEGKFSNGYIPISFKDTNYITEQARQRERRFPLCLCSNFEPNLAQAVVGARPLATKENFSQITLGTYSESLSHKQCCPAPPSSDKVNLQGFPTCPPKDKARDMVIFKNLVDNLVTRVVCYTINKTQIKINLLSKEPCSILTDMHDRFRKTLTSYHKEFRFEVYWEVKDWKGCLIVFYSAY